MIETTSFEPTSPRKRKDVVRLGGQVLVAAIFLLPLLLLISASLRSPALPSLKVFELWPTAPTLANYERLFDILPLGRYALNSLIVVALAVPITLLTASLAGFAMAQLPTRPRNLLAGLSVAALLVPVMALWLTRFLIYKWIGVLGSLSALILPALLGSSPFYVLMLFWAFRRLPPEVYEAARLDGAGAWRIWWSIALPLVRPTMIAVGVLSFVYYWSNFIDPLLYINKLERQTLPVALQALLQMHNSEWSLLMAGAVVVTLPVVVLFVFTQRYFLQENTGGWFGR